MLKTSNQLSNLQWLLPALFFIAVAALNTGSSGGFRYGGDEEEGSGFGGTGRTPTGGSGLGGTGLKPFLGDAGEVRIRFEPDAIVIAGQVVEEEIRRMPEASEVLPPVTVVTTPEFAGAFVPDAEPDSARITWAELARYLVENGSPTETDDVMAPEAAESPAAVQRPNRIRRPELPQVQRGRVIQRPTILPPRVQPMRF